MREAILYKKLANDVVECSVCTHRCKISDGQRGICSVRKNRQGTLYALNYQKAISEAIDPIEKKPFFHFSPGSYALSVATLGCNFRCDNCQNWQISQGSKISPEIIGEEISPKDVVSHAIAHKCSSIAYTYTEPTIFIEYALDTMKLATERGLKNVWVSNGFMTAETLKTIKPYLNAINIDLKYFDNKKYLKYCGGRLQPILDNIVALKKMGAWVEITTLAIPSLSDDEKTFTDIAKFINDKVGSDTPWHVSKFAPEISFKMNEFSATEISALEKAAAIGKKVGLKYIYIGNVPNHKLENTFCPECNNMVIERLGYQVVRRDDNGTCPNCQTKLSIITN